MAVSRAAVMSCKRSIAVELNRVAAAAAPGSAVHDEIGLPPTPRRRVCGLHATAQQRRGHEGGVPNGEDIRVRGYLKPIFDFATTAKSVDFEPREPVQGRL